MHDAPTPDRAKVRRGLALISVASLVALGLLFVVDNPVGRAAMLAVFLSGFVRAYLLTRSLRFGR